MMVVYEVLISILNSIRCYQTLRCEHSSPWKRRPKSLEYLIFEQGLLYCMVVTGLTVASLVLRNVAGPESSLKRVLNCLTLPMSGLLTARFLLHLREHNESRRMRKSLEDISLSIDLNAIPDIAEEQRPTIRSGSNPNTNPEIPTGSVHPTLTTGGVQRRTSSQSNSAGQSVKLVTPVSDGWTWGLAENFGEDPMLSPGEQPKDEEGGSIVMVKRNSSPGSSDEDGSSSKSYSRRNSIGVLSCSGKRTCASAHRARFGDDAR